MSSKGTINVIGLGYIGLPTAMLFAKAGYSVVGYDTDEIKIRKLNQGLLYIDEPGLDLLFEEVTSLEKIVFTNELPPAGVHVVCVPTPVDYGKADLTYVKSALNEVSKVVREGDLVILESTVGPNDCDEYVLPIIYGWGKSVQFALCTERAIPGNTLHEMVANDRVIGVQDDSTGERVNKIYATVVSGNILTTNLKTAALVKVMENTYRAINIAYANELAKIADREGFDVWQAIKLANNHPRVNIHQPGPGVGGHCIPIDPYFLVDGSEQTKFIEYGLRVNEGMPEYVSSQLASLLAKLKIESPKICILGLAYKKDTDDERETPAEKIKMCLEELGYNDILFSDPYISSKELVPTDTALSKSNVVLVATDHTEYQSIDFAKYNNIALVYDTRNIIRQEQVLGKEVYWLGK